MVILYFRVDRPCSRVLQTGKASGIFFEINFISFGGKSEFSFEILFICFRGKSRFFFFA
jgi:hypothetical protein